MSRKCLSNALTVVFILSSLLLPSCSMRSRGSVSQKPAGAPTATQTMAYAPTQSVHNVPAGSAKKDMIAGAPSRPQMAGERQNLFEEGKNKAQNGSGAREPEGTEDYDKIVENSFMRTDRNPISTFSIDVDTASYSNMRRFLTENSLPPKDAVRIEEMINYFTYDYPQPQEEAPFSITTEVSSCPYNKNHRLVLIGLQGKKLALEKLPRSNLVFLIDTSGSMQDPNKLPLLKAGFKMLTNQLNQSDRVSIVAYAGSAGVVLPSTPGSDKNTILQAIDNLQAGGSTAGGEGIKLAYDIAVKNFIQNGNNRVLLATDGDFNVGISDDASLVQLIEEKRKKGVYLSILGFGMGNLKDSKMEKLADHGNGNYAYIDSLNEAKKVLVTQMGGTLFTIAKDVKIQVLFNPAIVKGYRLLGYENRMLATKDFNDDTKDAGELGAGHTVTALYELIPASSQEGVPEEGAQVVKETEKIDPFKKNELLVVKLRYKKPTWSRSDLIVKSLDNHEVSFENASRNLRFASAVATFGLLLRDSKYKGDASFEKVIVLAKEGKGVDLEGYRGEFIQLVEKAKALGVKK
jgi:Ca-activated chloride channel homolog